ncbi:hypothetical protein OAX11_02160 [Flavobacteriaceae bacterium]|nr:hypothetical protein [Flavobacteriaceae bacterium]
MKKILYLIFFITVISQAQTNNKLKKNNSKFISELSLGTFANIYQPNKIKVGYLMSFHFKKPQSKRFWLGIDYSTIRVGSIKPKEIDKIYMNEMSFHVAPRLYLFKHETQKINIYTTSLLGIRAYFTRSGDTRRCIEYQPRIIGCDECIAWESLENLIESNSILSYGLGIGGKYKFNKLLSFSFEISKLYSNLSTIQDVKSYNINNNSYGSSININPLRISAKLIFNLEK